MLSSDVLKRNVLRKDLVAEYWLVGTGTVSLGSGICVR